MKIRVLIVMMLFIQGIGMAQILEPVKWVTSVKKISNTECELITTAKIDASWHLYSQNVPDNGPIPTTFTYEGNGNYLKKGNTSEENGDTSLDPVFKIEIKFFKNEVTFRQRIKLKTQNSFRIVGVVEFMACDDSRCLPPTEVELVFKIN
jgi:thiol:disulfide interchange protein DsbD